MEGDLLKTFDTLPILESEKINDATDQIPMTHAAGTVEQGDVGITPNILQSCTILRCNSDAKSASKVCEYVGGMPLTGSIEQCAGRTVLVIFTNGNDVENPQINYKNASGPIILINQASNVTVGKGCWTAGSRQLFTIDGSAWVMHSNVAQQTSEYTILADGRIEYSANKILSNYTDYNFTLSALAYGRYYAYQNIGKKPTAISIINSSSGSNADISVFMAGNTLNVSSLEPITVTVRCLWGSI